MPGLFDALDSAIAKFENVNPSYNNPGGIMFGDYAKQYGATGAAGNGLAIFPTLDHGTAAQDNLVAQYAKSGLTIRQLVEKWAPRSAGNPNNDNYTSSIVGDLNGAGISATPDTPVAATQQGGNPDIPFGSGSMNPPDSGNANTGQIVPSESGVASPVLDAVTGNWWGSLSRVAVVVVGVLLIGGGLLLFRPVQEAVVSSAKVAVAA